MSKLLILLFGLIISQVLSAKVIGLAKGLGTYSISIPDNYQYYPTFMGLENVIMAPQDNKLGTSSLSITLTGLPDTKLDSKELSVSQKDYQEGRKKFLAERNLDLIQFIPYALKRNPDGHQIHTVGVVYFSGDKITVDRSFMIECPKSFIHAKFVGDVGTKGDLKSLTSSFFQSSVQKEFENSILTLTCNKK